jgi:hypothetical protein
LQDFGCGGEIPLGIGQVHVSKIRRQMREQALDVCSEPVPLQNPAGSKAVAQIMQSRLIPRTIFALYTNQFAKLAKVTLYIVPTEAFALSAHKEN